MTTSVHHNGRIPTDPITLIAGLCTLYLLLLHLTPDQRDAIAVLTGLAGLALQPLPGRR